MVGELNDKSIITSQATPTKAIQHVVPQTLTLPAMDAGSRSGLNVWSRLFVWLPYGIFTLCLLALVAASFFAFHRKHGHKYRRRRSDVWQDIDMQTLTEHAPHVNHKPVSQSSEANGDEPESQSLLATCPKPKRQRKEPIKFAPNLNGSLTDVRHVSNAPPTNNNSSASAPPRDSRPIGRSSSLRQTTGSTMTSSSFSARSKRPLDVMTSVCESPTHPTAEYEGGGGGRGLDKRHQSLRVERTHRTLMRSMTDSDDVIRLVLRGNDSDVTTSSARPARVSLPARELSGYYSDQVVTSSLTRPAPSLKSQRTLPSQPPVASDRGGLVRQTSSRSSRQLPQPPAARV